MTASTLIEPAALSKATADQLNKMIDTPGIYVVAVTPEMAGHLLTRNTKNRRPKVRAIENYKKAMQQGRWRLTNQGLGFDVNGALTDGQNRLIACRQSGCTFETMIVTGLDPESRELVDVGVKRLFADVLRMHDYVNVMQLSGGVGLRFRYEKLVAGKRPYHQFNVPLARGSHEELLEMVRSHPSLAARASMVWGVTRAFPVLPASSVVAFESMASEIDPQALEEFRHSLITGADLHARDPRLVLRNFLARTDPTRKGGPNAMYHLGLLIKTWNDWRNGLQREMVMMRDNEAMPAMDARPSAVARRARGRD